MWDRLQRWAFDRFGEELVPALGEHLKGRGVGGADRPADDEDLTLSLGWCLLDRRLACGDTPARLYAGRPELPERERWLAGRIAASRLGVHRVVDVDPGAWMELEDVLTGARARVDSPNVSVDAVRWTVLICRVERGGPVPALWGGAAFYMPSEEPEILAELRRIARANGLPTDAAGLAAALGAGADEMACYVPPSRRAERILHTLEGDPLVFAEATWRLADRAAALRALRGAPGLVERRDDDGNVHVFDWVARRRDLLARRPPLPPGAVVMEDMVLDERGDLLGNGTTSLGTFTVRGQALELWCLSSERLDGAVALVERTLGPLAGGLERRLRSVEEAREEARKETGGGRAGGSPQADSRRRAGPRVPPGEVDARILELVYRRWIDDPNPALGGLSPREAARRPEHRRQLEQEVRLLEHRSARDRHDGLPGPDAAWLRRALALDGEPVAR